MSSAVSQHSIPDVLVIGAGINGAAVAGEAALDGLGVTIVDAEDLAAGASSASSRLIHGGLRYLENGEFRLVRQSLAERERLVVEQVVDAAGWGRRCGRATG